MVRVRVTVRVRITVRVWVRVRVGLLYDMRCLPLNLHAYRFSDLEIGI